MEDEDMKTKQFCEAFRRCEHEAILQDFLQNSSLKSDSEMQNTLRILRGMPVPDYVDRESLKRSLLSDRFDHDASMNWSLCETFSLKVV